MATSPTRKIKPADTNNPLMNPVLPTRNLIPVEGHQHLYRDSRSGAILNTNKSAYFNAVRKKLEAKDKKNEMETLKNEVSELKQLVQQLVDQLNT